MRLGASLSSAPPCTGAPPPRGCSGRCSRAVWNCKSWCLGPRPLAGGSSNDEKEEEEEWEEEDVFQLQEASQRCSGVQVAGAEISSAQHLFNTCASPTSPTTPLMSAAGRQQVW